MTNSEFDPRETQVLENTQQYKLQVVSTLAELSASEFEPGWCHTYGCFNGRSTLGDADEDPRYTFLKDQANSVPKDPTTPFGGTSYLGMSLHAPVRPCQGGGLVTLQTKSGLAARAADSKIIELQEVSTSHEIIRYSAGHAVLRRWVRIETNTYKNRRAIRQNRPLKIAAQVKEQRDRFNAFETEQWEAVTTDMLSFLKAAIIDTKQEPHVYEQSAPSFATLLIPGAEWRPALTYAQRAEMEDE
ncbi:MAG TPA: hypothetical protein VF733_04015 [Candidatus Saccharimonadales bacterium]